MLANSAVMARRTMVYFIYEWMVLFTDSKDFSVFLGEEWWGGFGGAQ